MCVTLQSEVKLNGIEHAMVDEEVKVGEEVLVLVLPGKDFKRASEVR